MAIEISTGKEYIETQTEGAGIISLSFNSESHIKTGCASAKYIEAFISVQEDS